MRPSVWRIGPLCALLLTAVGVGAGPAWAEGEREEQEEQITMADLPPAVKAVVEQQTAGCEIKEIEKETKDDRMIYEVEFIREGQEIELKLAGDGTILKLEAEHQHEGQHPCKAGERKQAQEVEEND